MIVLMSALHFAWVTGLAERNRVRWVVVEGMHIVSQKEKTFCKLVKNTIFTEKTFMNCSILPHQRMPYLQISRRKLLRIAITVKVVTLTLVFCFESFLLYGYRRTGFNCVV